MDIEFIPNRFTVITGPRTNEVVGLIDGGNIARTTIKQILSDKTFGVLVFPEIEYPLPELVLEIEAVVRNTDGAAVVTNSHFVTEAFEIYCKKYTKSAKFILANEDVCEYDEAEPNVYEYYASVMHFLEIEKFHIECREED